MEDTVASSAARPDAAEVASGATRQLLHAETAEEVGDILLTAVHHLGGAIVVAEHADETALPVDLTVGAGRPVLPTAEAGSVACMHLERHLPALVADARQALDAIARAERLSRDATTDSLTHLGNRGAFTRLLAGLGPDDVLVALDLDGFKEINDTYGHGAGDEVLRAFSAGRTPGLTRPTATREAADGALYAAKAAGKGCTIVAVATDADEREPMPDER